MLHVLEVIATTTVFNSVLAPPLMAVVFGMAHSDLTPDWDQDRMGTSSSKTQLISHTLNAADSPACPRIVYGGAPAQHLQNVSNCRPFTSNYSRWHGKSVYRLCVQEVAPYKHHDYRAFDANSPPRIVR